MEMIQVSHAIESQQGQNLRTMRFITASVAELEFVADAMPRLILTLDGENRHLNTGTETTHLDDTPPRSLEKARSTSVRRMLLQNTLLQGKRLVPGPGRELNQVIVGVRKVFRESLKTTKQQKTN